MLEYLTSLNDHNLPYPDPLHPIVVHFVIAMILFAVFCDFVGFITGKNGFFEVAFWNLFVATVSIFIAIIFGQFEAGLAKPYNIVKSVLNYHSLIGWSLSGILAAITGWRYILRSRDPKRLPIHYLAVAVLLTILVGYQVYLGDELVWVYGIHTVPVVEAVKDGILP
jgi:uncharacterized membrane protein